MSDNKQSNVAVTVVSIICAALLALVGLVVAVYALTYESSEEAVDSSVQERKNVDGDTHEHRGSNDKSQATPADLTKKAAAVIAYSDEGFATTLYQVKSGEIVRVQNVSKISMYFTTGDHHNHDITSPLNLGVLQPGQAADFIAPAAGVYGFHNHDDETQAGELIVQ